MGKGLKKGDSAWTNSRRYALFAEANDPWVMLVLVSNFCHSLVVTGEGESIIGRVLPYSGLQAQVGKPSPPRCLRVRREARDLNKQYPRLLPTESKIIGLGVGHISSRKGTPTRLSRKESRDVY